jgi:hypothetical protein
MRYLSKNSLLAAIAMAEFLAVGVLDTSWAIRLEIVSTVSWQMLSETGWLCIPRWMQALDMSPLPRT